MNKVLAILQARMGSSRLPGKTLADVAGKPMLMRVVDQVKSATFVDDVIVATSDLSEDDKIERYCLQNDILFYRGDSSNVLSRFIACANLIPHSTVIRITADCPLISPDTIDEVIQYYWKSGDEYVNNTDPYTRPEGQDVEVFSRQLLLRSGQFATTDIEKEHVTPWMRFAEGVKRSVCFHDSCNYSDAHWSVDYQQDLNFVRRVWECLSETNKLFFNFEDIIKAIMKHEIPMSDIIVNEGYYKSIYASASCEKSAPLNLDKSKEWLERSDKVVPGGAQTYSKSWRHHIKGVTPIFLESGDGCWVKDVDGNSYIDFIQGLLPNILGYADQRVNDAVTAQIKRGHSFSLPTTLEVELAEKLTKIIPCAEKVRFGKNGSDATTGAIRVARAFTGRNRVAACGYHGWHDWYIGTTSRNLGVPTATRELTSTFEYNSVASLETVLESHKGEYAAVILEAFNFDWPSEGYLEEVKRLTHKHGAVLIFDEICSGFHFGIGGVQKMFGVTPDLATFGKAMGNGWPISCIAGKEEIMNVFEDAFFSFTFGGDNASIAAALKVIDILENENDYEKMRSAGVKLRDGLNVFAKEAGLENKFNLKGHHNWMVFDFLDDDGRSDKELKTLWLQEVTRRGLLVLTTLNISSALSDSDVHDALNGFAHAFKYVSNVRQSSKNIISYLDGEIPTPAFKARN